MVPRRFDCSRLMIIGVLLGASMVASGCATTPEPTPLTVQASEYDLAFDAALVALRERGLEPAIRDRRGGVIETNPAPAPSLLEPWRSDPGTLKTRADQTAQHLRRRARVEFAPVGPVPPEPVAPDLLGLTRARTDLTELSEGEIEMRISVFLEQAHEPGLRRSTWSRKATSRSIVYTAGEYDDPLPSRFWTPTSRDPWFEAALLSAVSDAAGIDTTTATE